MVTGDIKINDQTFVSYEIENTGETVTGLAVYICRISGYDNKGYPFNKRYAVLHEPNDGLIVLVHGALQKAALVMMIDG